MADGNFEYQIEMGLQAIAADPRNLALHRELRDVSLRRKAAGGRDLGFVEKMKLKRRTPDPLTEMLKAEKQLSYDPANSDLMLEAFIYADLAGLQDVCCWFERLIRNTMDH